MLAPDLCDYSDAYIFVKGRVTVIASNNGNYDKIFTLSNNPPFISCISRINSMLLGNAKDLDVVMSMQNLIKYNKNYRKTTGKSVQLL